MLLLEHRNRNLCINEPRQCKCLVLILRVRTQTRSTKPQQTALHKELKAIPLSRSPPQRLAGFWCFSSTLSDADEAFQHRIRHPPGSHYVTHTSPSITPTPVGISPLSPPNHRADVHVSGWEVCAGLSTPESVARDLFDVLCQQWCGSFVLLFFYHISKLMEVQCPGKEFIRTRLHLIF